MSVTYRQIARIEVPADIRFDTPRAHQGQIVEVSYGDRRKYRGEFGEGDPYKRVIDRSTGETTFYKIDK